MSSDETRLHGMCALKNHRKSHHRNGQNSRHQVNFAARYREIAVIQQPARRKCRAAHHHQNALSGLFGVGVEARIMRVQQERLLAENSVSAHGVLLHA